MKKTEANKINCLSKVLQLVMAALGFEPHCVQFQSFSLYLAAVIFQLSLESSKLMKDTHTIN